MQLFPRTIGTLATLGTLLLAGQAAAYTYYDPYDYGTNYYRNAYDLPRDTSVHHGSAERPGYVCHYYNENNECMEYSYISGSTTYNYYVPHYVGNRYYDDTYYRSRSSMRSYCYDRYDDRYDNRTCRDYRNDYDGRDCYRDGYYNSNYCSRSTRRLTYTRSTRYDDCYDRYDYYGSRNYNDDCRYNDYYYRTRSASQYCNDRYDSRYQTLYCQRYRRDDITGTTYRYDYDYRYNDRYDPYYYYDGYYRY